MFLTWMYQLNIFDLMKPFYLYFSFVLSMSKILAQLFLQKNYRRRLGTT